MENTTNENSLPLGVYLGAKIKQLRNQHELTIAAVAGLAGISRGMLSKIENAQAAASLETLAQIAKALGVTLSHLFADYEKPAGGAQLVKSGAGMEVVRRGTRNGHTYQLLAYDQGPDTIFEPFLITIEDAQEAFNAFEHAGVEFIYMIDGKLEYQVGTDFYILEPGDALTFRGEIPHKPSRILQVPVRFLSIIQYEQDYGDE